MQDLLSGLQPPIMIGLIIAAIIALVVVVMLARRLRNSRTPTPGELSPGLEGPVDYTALPLEEEPRGWRERFARLSLAGKILAILVPLLAILGLLVLVLTLLPPAQPTVSTQPPVPVTLTVQDAAVVRAEPMTVDLNVATTGLDDGAAVTAEMFEDGEPFAWLNPEQARGTVRRDRAEFQVQRAEGAPTPTEGRRYTIVVRGPDGVASGEAELTIPAISGIAESFYGREAVAVEPTAAPATPTARPTTAPAPTTAATAEPTATPVPALPEGPPAAVSNGGNLRALPIIANDNVIGGVNAGEQVQLIARTPNGQWFNVRTVRDELGWVSASLINVPGDAAVPVANVVTVFANGPVYESADPASTEVDRVNQDEVVVLLQRTAAGDWYQVTNVRTIDGWVQAALLGIPDEVAAAVPVAP